MGEALMPPTSTLYTCIHCGRQEWYVDDQDAFDNDWEVMHGPISGDKWACYERPCIDRLHGIWERTQESLEQEHGAGITKHFTIKGDQWGKNGQEAGR